MRKIRSPYELWVSKILRTRISGCLLGWILWASIALVLFSYFIFHNPQNPFDFTTAIFSSSSPPPIIFVARENMPVFTVLTKNNFVVEQDRGNQHAYSSNLLEQQEQLFYSRITLHPYSKGEEIQLSELGPKVSLSIPYQVREIDAKSTFSWMEPGEKMNFLLENTACPPQNATPITPSSSSTCLPQTTSTTLVDVVILRVGKIGENGIVSLLVAIPSVENKETLQVLDQYIQNIVVYPEINTTSNKSVTLNF